MDKHRNKKIRSGKSSDDIPPEAKFLKKGWASRDEQRFKRGSYKQLTKRFVANWRNTLESLADK